MTEYKAPSIELLTAAEKIEEAPIDIKEVEFLESFFAERNVPVKVISSVSGPNVVRYELELPVGVPIRSVEKYAADIESEIDRGKIRIEAPIPGKRAVALEIPHKEKSTVRLREILESKDHASSASPLTVALGKDTAGNGVICDLNRISHLLIGGCSGSGKTSCIKSMIASIVYKASPAEVRFILAETKGVELDIFAGMPHLLGGEVVHAENLIVRALHWLSREITRRVNTFRERDVNSIKAYNKLDGIACDESLRLPYIVFIVDEIADLMNGDYRRQIEDLLVRIVPAARAVGVQLVLSSQQLNVKVISQTIRVNIPSRISFATVSNVDSRVILDDGGAETLSRRGDMLYAPITTSYSVRVQGAYVSDKELQAICDSVRADNEANFCEDFIRAVNGEYPD